MVPHKFLSKKEFLALTETEGGTLTVFHLTNIPFDPPLPDGDTIPTRQLSINVLLMNVAEPMLYRDEENNIGFVVLNGYDEDSAFSYESFRDCHIIKDPVNAWGYRLNPSWWDEDDLEEDMADPIYRFRHEEYAGQGLDDVKGAA